MKSKRSQIGNVTVGSNLPVIVWGSVRGMVSEHRSIAAARKSLARDQRACAGLSSGLTRTYSDASVYLWSEDGGWVALERLTL